MFSKIAANLDTCSLKLEETSRVFPEFSIRNEQKKNPEIGKCTNSVCGLKMREGRGKGEKEGEREREIMIAKEEMCSFLQIKYFGFEYSQFYPEKINKQIAWHMGLCTDTATPCSHSLKKRVGINR